ncbi:hypothetical protein PACTADRAFT_32058 [Pachysolen tannophilus NRRL Y-2460]|uniref:Zn(2)-C6 fungal-type domain-containing protein n=1 Tax=Pachysolen tannophilus NRRL Y-2460 TaxID=669874 RepID=A0A1E4TXV1_PACTA|nr:hypothetical protein PACTADRAFT_32058 [Pachysolen tannophilus NRRL Y-2460]
MDEIGVEDILCSSSEGSSVSDNIDLIELIESIDVGDRVDGVNASFREPSCDDSLEMRHHKNSKKFKNKDEISNIKNKTKKRRPPSLKNPACLSCKKLKIKCDRVKPKCEYCHHTGRNCTYPVLAIENLNYNHNSSFKNKKKLQKKLQMDLKCAEFLVNQRNSNTLLLNVTATELQLLAFYRDFNAQWFCCEENPEAAKVWSETVPALWKENKNIRDGIYCISSIRLWSEYDLNSLQNVRLNQEDESLYEYTGKYFGLCIQALQEVCSAIINTKNQKDIDDKVGEIMVLNYIIFSFLGIHPHKVVPLINLKGLGFDFDDRLMFNVNDNDNNNDNDNGKFDCDYDDDGADIFSIVSGFKSSMAACFDRVVASDFKALLYLKERIRPEEDMNFTGFSFISHLYSKLDRVKLCFSTDEYNTLHQTIKELEVCAYRSTKFEYAFPLFRFLFHVPSNFKTILKNGNIFAMKVLFIYSCACVLTCFHLFKETNIWVDFIYFYRNLKVAGNYQKRNKFRNIYNIDTGMNNIDYENVLYDTILWDSDDQKLYNFVFDSRFQLTRHNEIESLFQKLEELHI